ncbi:hypothetical protein P9E76_17150 [Schinkia azotoformans]|uniref:Uncharacterized protein n=1 Tax=Schinkia azotoformans LMG 9581 TaxID=1131731 RepID=K6DRW2_SCHAZ|nr:hypothetical protein [Schinkia azotoformans]EKN63486.1 hypothetical protein BAZO_17479 [Schinkia azotoformans LMG 9581]MEC1638785.1 hypothetical protein [Schinkia azotoformans]MEC1946750.1 hypothetical protein [Schinkia azotoformans]
MYNPNSHKMTLSNEEYFHLLEWWKTMESGKPVIQRLVSLVSELRIHPEASHAGGIILFYRAISEVSYGYAGVRGCIRRAFTDEYGHSLRTNMGMCHRFAHRFSIDSKVLLARLEKEISGRNALLLINRIKEVLNENDRILEEIENKANTFFGKETFQSLKKEISQANMVPKIR